MLKTKADDPKLENLPKIQTNPRLLRFSPKSFAYNFRLFCCYFRSIRLKNKSVKSLGHLTRQFTKVKYQHMMTCFCTQTIPASFLDILLLFPINMVKKMLRAKVYDPKLKNLPKIETNPRLLHFSPKFFAHNFWSFCCCFRSIRLKNKSFKSLGHLHDNSQKLNTNTWWLVFAPKPFPHHFWSFYCCFPSIWLKNA